MRSSRPIPAAPPPPRRTWCPVVLTSSIRTATAPAGACPSTCDRAVCLRLLPDDGDRQSVSRATAATSRVAAPSGAARWSVPGGRSFATSAARSRRRSGRVRNAELVEVDRRATSARQHEVAVQLGDLDEPPHQVVVHRSASIGARWAGTRPSAAPRSSPSRRRPPTASPPRCSVCRSPGAHMGGVPDDPSLATTVAGISLRTPIGLAAGFDKRCAHLDALGRLGFGYVVGGTITRTPGAGNPKPRIVRYPQRRSMVNAMGLPNPGAEAAAAEPRADPQDRPSVRERRGRGPWRCDGHGGTARAPRRRDRAERELPERVLGTRPGQRGAPRRPAGFPVGQDRRCRCS